MAIRETRDAGRLTHSFNFGHYSLLKIRELRTFECRGIDIATPVIENRWR